MCGPDLDRDSTSLDVPAEDFSAAERLARRPAHRRPAEFFGEGLAPTCAPPSTPR
jgi:aspartyl-tRNA(Asn)/glutamyl-tRNA(Gln) amidotransferase subunit A